jgi:ribosomal protein S12 methylthiotransferase
MLERMRRPERVRTLREKLAWLRGAIPDLAIRTTCLVGFPGETEEDFRALLAFLEEAQFDRMGAFAYSPQEGTRAFQFEDDVDNDVKQDRLAEIVEVQRSISAERLERFVGREVEVLVDQIEAENGIKAGRVQWQADDVDGITYLERGGWAQPGDFVRARITASEDYDFQAAALT